MNGNDTFNAAIIHQQLMQFFNETKEFERKVGIIIPTIFAIVVIIGVLGNALVILVALNRQMRNSTNTLIIGLTISDLMFLTLCVPFTAIDYAYPKWVLPIWTCNMINYLQHSSAYFSVWTLTLMAADRFLAVCYPVQSMTLRNPKNTCIALVITYTLILLSQIQVGKIHDVYDYTFIAENRSACSIVSIAKGEASVVEARIYFFAFNIFGYVLPLGITCVLYYLMLKKLWYTPRPGGGSSKNTGSIRSRPETIRAKRKVTRLVLCVVVIWAVCWFPLNLCFFFSGVVYPDTLVMRGGKPIVIVQISSQVLAYANSCLNPILYALVSDNFRKGFIRVICVAANKITFGKFCKSCLNYNARMEVTFYNGSNSNRLSRTNSSHRTVTHQVITESSSLLLKSPLAASSPGLSNEIVSTTPTIAETEVVLPSTKLLQHRQSSSVATRLKRVHHEHGRPHRARTYDEFSSS